MRHVIWLLFVSLFFLPAVAQEADVKREREFTGTGLFGFMNGGAELFFEYDVERLTTRDIVFEGEEFTVDIYDMPTPEDAYGIYSMHVFRCERADTLDFANCLSPYQYQAVCGNKYVSIVFPSGSSTAKRLTDDVLRLYIPTEKEENSFNLPQQFPAETLSGRVKFVRGPLSAMGANAGLYTLLKDITFISAWFSGKKSEGQFHTLIYFDNQTEMQKLKERITDNELIEEGINWLLLKRKEAEKEENTNPFGF